MWTWVCYDDGEDVDLWSRWYQGVDDDVRGIHDVRIDYLEPRPAAQWREPYTKRLNHGIVEIRITGPVQHRLLGFFGTTRAQFTIVLSCTHKMNVYSPKDAKRTAAKRKMAIESGVANVRICKRPG